MLLDPLCLIPAASKSDRRTPGSMCYSRIYSDTSISNFHLVFPEDAHRNPRSHGICEELWQGNEKTERLFTTTIKRHPIQPSLDVLILIPHHDCQNVFAQLHINALKYIFLTTVIVVFRLFIFTSVSLDLNQRYLHCRHFMVQPGNIIGANECEFESILSYINSLLLKPHMGIRCFRKDISGRNVRVGKPPARNKYCFRLNANYKQGAKLTFASTDDVT